MSNNNAEMNANYNPATTFVYHIVCKKCNVVLQPHTMNEHLDITHMVHCCETGHMREPFVDTNKLQRMDMLDKYYDVLSRLVGTGKGSKLRKEFVRAFRSRATATFVSYDDEYECINKFGRGMWDKRFITAFPPQIQEIITKEIAVAFGAFQF